MKIFFAALLSFFVSSGSWAAVDFDGTDDYITMGDVLDFERTSSFSFAAWLKRDGTGTNDMIISSLINGQPFTGYRWNFSSGDNIEFWFINNHGGGNYLRAYASPAASTVWEHWLLTYDGSSAVSGVKMYKNGVSQSIFAAIDSLSATTVGTGVLNIGGEANSGDFNGLIEDVRIYNRVLSAGEIETLANSKIKYGPVGNGLVGYWPLDEAGAGDGIRSMIQWTGPNAKLSWSMDSDVNPIFDITGNGNNGTRKSGTEPAFTSTFAKNGGFDWDETDDYITAPNSTSLEISGDVSIGFYFDPSDFNQVCAEYWVVVFGGNSETEANNVLYGVKINDVSNHLAADQSKIDFYWENGSGMDTEVTSDQVSGLFIINQTYCVVVTRDTAANEVKYFSDGAQVGATKTYTNDPTGGTTSTLTVGQTEAGTCTMNSIIDELTILDKKLTAAEVKEFCDGIAKDRSGGGNDGLPKKFPEGAASNLSYPWGPA